MRPSRVSFLLAGLIALGAGSAAARAAQPDAPPPGSAASADPSPEHATYIQKARAELQEWRRDLDAFDVKGRADGQVVADRLNLAWANTKTAAVKLEATGELGWERAKASFEAARQQFTAEFTKARSTPAAAATP
jgi:hypothetical protein